MTVKQLIDLLKNHDPDLTVVVNLGKNELANGCPASAIELLNAYRYNNSDQWHESWFDHEGDDDDISYQNVLNITC